MHPFPNLPSSQDCCRGIRSSPFSRGLQIEAPSTLAHARKLSTSEDEVYLHSMMPNSFLTSNVTTPSSNLEEEWRAMSGSDWANQGSAMDMTDSDEILDMWLNAMITQGPYLDNDCVRNPESPAPSQPDISGSTACSHASNNNLFYAPSPLFSEASSHVPNPHLSLDQQYEILSLNQQDVIPSINNPRKRTGLPESLRTPPSKRMVAPPSSSWCTPPDMDRFFNQPSPYSANEVSSYASSPPPRELNLEARASPPPPLNMAARLCLPESNLEGKASPFQPYLGADHRMDGPRDTKKTTSISTKSSNAVQFLVESSTPAVDDGYTWRKYGQKKIKNKIHPRGYFRCAQDDCPVKKQTEASSDMPGFVWIAYFARHNH